MRLLSTLPCMSSSNPPQPLLHNRDDVPSRAHAPLGSRTRGSSRRSCGMSSPDVCSCLIFLEGLKTEYGPPHWQGSNIHPHTTGQSPGPTPSSLLLNIQILLSLSTRSQLNPELPRKEFAWEEGTGLSPSPAKPEPL